MNNKKSYENVTIEITLLKKEDVITTSGAFNGLEDRISDWNKR